MKSILLMIAAFTVSATSNALIVDNFKCTLEVRDLNSPASAKEEKIFFIARIPLFSPDKSVQMSVGQTLESLWLETPKAEITGNLNFYYKHALKTGVNGSLEARQNTCIGLSGDYCAKSDDGKVHICSSSLLACAESPNPFDPNTGWAITGVTNGMPMFNEQTLAPAIASIRDNNGNEVATASLTCHLLGSFK